MSQVNAVNAYQFSDNFCVYRGDSADFGFVGCEHNETEALALAAYLESESGQRHWVRRNGKDDVRAAKEFHRDPARAKEVLRTAAFQTFDLGGCGERQPSKRHIVWA